MVFWTVMTVIDAICAITLFALSIWGARIGISHYTRRRMRGASYLLLVWTAVSLAKAVRQSR
jgi:hypothetical protein